MDEPITPPVPQDVLGTLEKRADPVVVTELDKVVPKQARVYVPALVAAALHVAVLLVMALVMKLPARDVAELGAIVTAGSSYFVAKPK